MDARDVATNVQYYMKLNNISIKQLAKRINRTYSYVHRLVTGVNSNIKLSTVNMLAEGLGVSSEDLLQPRSVAKSQKKI